MNRLAASSSSALGGPAPANVRLYRPQFVQGDRLKMIVLAGFVLFVFWAGVVVGMGFSHGHSSGELPAGLQILRQSHLLRTRPPPAVNNGDDDGPCCSGNLVRCLACKQSVSELEYCLTKQPTHKDCREFLPPPQAKFSGFGSSTFHTSTRGLDFNSLTIGAWVFLEPGAPEKQMKTVLANRESGCDKDDKHRGFSLYVNEWDTADRSLNVMWSSEHNTCEQLFSPKELIPYSKWTHVGAILINNEGKLTAELYINGKIVAQTERLQQRVLGKSDQSVYIGSHAGTAQIHPFKGHIAYVTITEGGNPDLFASNRFHPTELLARYRTVLSPGVEKTSLLPELGPEEPIDFLVPLGELTDVASGAWPEPDFVLTPELKQQSDELARERREVVRNAMKFAYGQYEAKAFGADEVMPRSGQPKTNWGGMAMTLVDSLDTLWIMGLKDEFYRARDYTRDKMSFGHIAGSISTFETTIRHLGGLMSAFDLSGDRAFLDRALDIGSGLAKAFSATKSGLPVNNVFINRDSQQSSGTAVIAEVGTLQLEFRALAFRSKQSKYAKLVENVHIKMREAPPKDGLWPMNVNLNTGHSSGGIVTFGAMGDSFFEYLIKIWVQGGKVESEYLADYDRAMDGMHEYIVQHSTPSGLVYLGDMNPGGNIHHKMDHLACFVPAMLVLGVKHRTDPAHAKVNARDLVIAKALLYTCVQMYERQATGISPEYVDFRPGHDFVVPPSAPFYILRPETVESLYYLHQLTGHPVYRDWGHRIMMKIERHCKLPYGYGALPDVRDPNRQPDDRQESFFFAETLKYLFLLQDPDSEINLDEWVFNTEAHPLRVFPKGWRTELGI